MDNISNMIKQARKAKGWSQRELGLRAGLPQSHISIIEAGRTDPRYSSLRILCQLLNLELMLIPREKTTWVNSIINNDFERLNQPRFLPDEEPDDGD